MILSFLFICLAARLLDMITMGQSNRMFFVTYHSSLVNPLTYLRFFTHVFGHASWEHLTGNAMYILLLGPMLEEKYGPATILELMAVTAFATGIINYVLFWNIALCGASGICFAFILLTSFTGFKEGEIPLTVLLVAAVFIGQQILEGMFVKDNISNLSHIIGGIVGAVFGFLWNRKKPVKPETVYSI